MNIFRKLFNNPKIECPRCLGKGEVDWDDIKRLKQEFRWIPGKCAYCNGKGKVSSEITSKIAVDNSYLTNDIGKEERRRLFKGDKGALYRAEIRDEEISEFINQVMYLHTVGNLNAQQILNFYLLYKSEAGKDEAEKKAMVIYIDKIIRKQTEGN